MPRIPAEQMPTRWSRRACCTSAVKPPGVSSRASSLRRMTSPSAARMPRLTFRAKTNGRAPVIHCTGGRSGSASVRAPSSMTNTRSGGKFGSFASTDRTQATRFSARADGMTTLKLTPGAPISHWGRALSGTAALAGPRRSRSGYGRSGSRGAGELTVQSDRLECRLNLEIVPDPLSADAVGALDLCQPSGLRQAVQQLADRIFAVRVGGEDLSTAGRRLVPLGPGRIGAAQPAQYAQPKLLERCPVRLGPLVVAALEQERPAVQGQRLLEDPVGVVNLAGRGQPPPPLTGGPEAVDVEVDCERRVETVLAIAVQDGLVVASRPASSQRPPQRVNRHLQAVRAGHWVPAGPERLDQHVA